MSYVTRALRLLVDSVELVNASASYAERAALDLHTLPKVPLLSDAAARAFNHASAQMRFEGVNVNLDTHVWADVVAELNVRKEQRARAIAFRKARDEQRAAELATYAI